VNYGKLNVEAVKDGLDRVFQRAHHITFKFIVDTGDQIDQQVPGNYLINVECGAKNQLILQANRIANLELKDCTGLRVEEAIVSVLSAVFSPEFSMLRQKYPPINNQNVHIL
jgi:hypothetical protein